MIGVSAVVSIVLLVYAAGCYQKGKQTKVYSFFLAHLSKSSG